MNQINFKYDIGEMLILVSDPEQHERIVVGYTVIPNNIILYRVCLGTLTSEHYEFELTEQPDILKALQS